MNTGKYARDTWAGVRKKLTGTAPKGGKTASEGKELDGDADGETARPKGEAKEKAKATPRKRKNGE